MNHEIPHICPECGLEYDERIHMGVCPFCGCHDDFCHSEVGGNCHLCDKVQ